jgi:nidogen (entactin)
MYLGLNVWDQLSSEIEISGSLPMLPPNDKVQMVDFTAAFKKVKDGVLQSNYEHLVYVPSEERDMSVHVYQQITYETNNYLNRLPKDKFEGTLKTSKINLGFEARENASRMGMLSKIGIEQNLNPCADESSNCGENTICTATGSDTYEVRIYFESFLNIFGSKLMIFSSLYSVPAKMDTPTTLIPPARG